MYSFINIILGFCGEYCGWNKDKSFECIWCEKTVCYCFGQSDDAPAVCNACWCKLHANEINDGVWSAGGAARGSACRAHRQGTLPGGEA